MTLDKEQREQYDYARRRIAQKKRLMRHFVFFLAGSVVLIVINLVLGIGAEWIVGDWSVWVILLWFFLLLAHVFNVFIMNTFMGKEWEDRQLERLKAKQQDRIADLQKQVDADLLKPTHGSSLESKSENTTKE